MRSRASNSGLLSSDGSQRHQIMETQPETLTNANLMCQNIDKNMKTESGSAPAHFLKLVLLLTDSVRRGHRSTRRAPCWRLFRSTRLFPQPHRTIHKTRMLFPRCLFAHLKQTLLELKLPVVPRAGAGSLLRTPPPRATGRRSLF